MPPRERLLQPADATLAHAVAGVLAEVPLDPRDAAARLLAGKLAHAIDDAEDQDAALKDLGPKLLAVLVELQCTPRARGVKGVGSRGPSRLDALRGARAN
jgi:hypothetical protein